MFLFLKARFSFALIVATFLLMFANAIIAQASTFGLNETFSHVYTIENTGSCDITITSITKSWESSGGANLSVNYGGGSGSGASGTGSYSLSYVLPIGGSVNTTLIFNGGSNICNDNIRSTLDFVYTDNCGNSLASSQGGSSTVSCPVPSGRCADTNSNGVFDACTATGTGPSCASMTFNNDCLNVLACNTNDRTCVLGGTGGACMVNSDCAGGGGGGGGTVCGNGVLEAGEVCDDGNTISGDGCSATCRNEGGGGGGGGGTVCGNGVLEAGEVCDDGNTISGDGCSATCRNEGGGGGGGACNLPLNCTEPVISANGQIPTLTPVNGKISLTFSGVACAASDDVCVQVRNAPIVGGYKNDPPAWSDCLSNPTIVGGRLEISVQSKNYYQVRARYGDGDFGEVCHFDTRIPPIKTVGSSCSNSLGSVADTGQICDNYYSEARNLMNPSIARIIEPFEKAGLCRASSCGPLCCCDATGAGARLSTLDPNSNYIAPDGSIRPLSECYNDVQDVVCFDPSGGSVTLDAPGDDFILPERPVTLIVKGADLRIPDNLVYSNNPKSSFGVVLLKNSYCPQYGGDAFISPKPTNIAGAYYLEGSLRTTDAAWHLPTNRNNASWFNTLRNQLFIAGALISRNTIGGAEDPTWPRFGQPKCPSNVTSGFVNCSWSEAIKSDLAYLREYFACLNPGSTTNYGTPLNCGAAGQIVDGGNSSRDVPATEAVVIKYDGRIQSNPPPGFETLATFLQKELGL